MPNSQYLVFYIVMKLMKKELFKKCPLVNTWCPIADSYVAISDYYQWNCAQIKITCSVALMNPIDYIYLL